MVTQPAEEPEELIAARGKLEAATLSQQENEPVEVHNLWSLLRLSAALIMLSCHQVIEKSAVGGLLPAF